MSRTSMDMTRGSLKKQILFFSIPLMLSNLLQVLFNMSDIAVIGQFAGAMSLGAVGSTTTLISMYTGFLIGLSGGINVLTALYIGARNRKSVSETVHSAFLVSLVVGLILLILGVSTSRGVLVLLNTKEELIDKAALYIRIYFLGILRYLFLSGIVNVILNLFFVIVCKLDVVGVALASALSQCLSAFLIVMALFRSHEDFGLHLAKLRLSKDKAQAILRLGIPSGFQNAIFGIANLFVQLGVNSFSAVMVAGNSAAANADALIYDVMAAFYTACASFMGQNYGSGNKKRVRDSYFVSLAYSFGIGLAMGLLLVVFGKQFLSLFTNDPEVMAAGMKRLTIMGFSYGISAFMDCTIAASRALGKSLAPMVIVILGSCVFRIAWVYMVFAYFQTIPSLYLLYSCSWSLTALAEILYFVHAYRRAMEKIAETRS